MSYLDTFDYVNSWNPLMFTLFKSASVNLVLVKMDNKPFVNKYTGDVIVIGLIIPCLNVGDNTK